MVTKLQERLKIMMTLDDYFFEFMFIAFLVGCGVMGIVVAALDLNVVEWRDEFQTVQMKDGNTEILQIGTCSSMKNKIYRLMTPEETKLKQEE